MAYIQLPVVAVSGTDYSLVDSANPLPITIISPDPVSVTSQDGLAVAAGSVSGRSSVNKFGSNTAVGTSFVPVCTGGQYRMPQVSGATTLRVKAGGNANDTVAGTGARYVTLQGLDATGAQITEIIATNGASASSATSLSFLRLYRAWVSASGTYATMSAGSHAASIVIEDSAGTQDWATISYNGFGLAQSQIAWYAVPLGFTAYIRTIRISVSSTKAADVILLKRENILETAAPYSALRLQFRADGVDGSVALPLPLPLKCDALTDIGFMARVTAGTGSVSAEFDMERVAA